jgi:DNA topoisomerase-1
MKDYIIRSIQSKRGNTYKYKYKTKTGKDIPKSIYDSLIKNIYIPPAYDNVKISKHKNSSILAIGEDSKGRKQYIYNDSFKQQSKDNKFTDMIDFGKAYSKIYRRIQKDIKIEDMNNKDKLCAISLKLIIDCNFRIGNEKYSKENNSFGVSTLERKHIFVDYNDIIIDFIGKRGVQNVCCVKDKRIKEFLKQRKKTHKKIFSYKKKRRLYTLKASDVNLYLKQFGDFSTKNFRTWGANIQFIKELLTSNEETIDKDIKKCIKNVSQKLHHTPNVCKQNYIEPTLLTFYEKKKKEFIHMFGKSKNNHDLSKQLTIFLNKIYS